MEKHLLLVLAACMVLLWSCNKESNDNRTLTCNIVGMEISGMGINETIEAEYDSLDRPSLIRVTSSIVGEYQYSYRYMGDTVIGYSYGDSILWTQLNAYGLPTVSIIFNKTYTARYSSSGELQGIEVLGVSVTDTTYNYYIANVVYSNGTITSFESYRVNPLSNDTAKRTFFEATYTNHNNNVSLDQKIKALDWSMYSGQSAISFDIFNPLPFNKNLVQKIERTGYRNETEEYSYQFDGDGNPVQLNGIRYYADGHSTNFQSYFTYFCR